MKFLNRIISIFIISTPLMFFQQAKCVGPEGTTSKRPRTTLKMKAKSHSTGEIKKYIPLQESNSIPIIRSHAQVRNELIKGVAKTISNTFCKLFIQ